MSSGDVRKLTLVELHELCARESDRFFRHLQNDSRYCFEIFRRAFEENNQDAWQILYDQFGAQIARWVKSYPGFVHTGEDVEFFINRSLEKFWKSNSNPEKFKRFESLDGLLKYLKLCVFSVITDFLRASEVFTVVGWHEHFGKEPAQWINALEREVIRKVEGQRVLRLIGRRLKDEKEYWVFYGSFVLGLKPRELYREMPERFLNVKQIYRIKENVLSRLRRDKDLKRIWDGSSGE